MKKKKSTICAYIDDDSPPVPATMQMRMDGPKLLMTQNQVCAIVIHIRFVDELGFDPSERDMPLVIPFTDLPFYREEGLL